MKKIIFAFLFLATSSLSLAQELTCLDKLLPFNRYSGQHNLLRTEWSDPTKDALDTDSATSALNYLISHKLMCKPNDVVIKVAPVCQLLIADVPSSNTCFTFTNLGYFFLTFDNVKNVNFTFSKDKTYTGP